MNKVYIIKYSRSPIGSFLSNFKNITLNELSKQVLDNLLLDFNRENIDKIYIGNVLSTGLGQCIARQIGFENNINKPSISINNVCGSGLLSIIEGYKSIKIGDDDCVLCGGVESMSNSPHYTNLRNKKYDNLDLKDSMINDGLQDKFTNCSMTELSEKICKEINITREEYDEYAKESYKKSREHLNQIKKEITPINIGNKIIYEDEEINKVPDLDKLDKLKTLYKNGVSTAGNISKLSDGVSFILLASEKFIKKNNIKPVAEIINYDLTICKPEESPICTTYAINKNKLPIDLYEVNEPFPLSIIHLNKTLNIEYSKINIFGGAISLGHPLGCSGNRIVCTLLNALKFKNKQYGCASIGNGGGGATTLYIKRLIY